MTEPALRILDVNLNRAREALRVIEDHARFIANDPAAAGRAKQARHDLLCIATAIGPETLLAARDILNDVGRETKTTTEQARGSITDVLRAAFGRLTEAARGLGEYAKLFSREAAAAAESLRYDAYELEQTLLLRGDLRARFRGVRLYVIVTAALCRGEWLDTAAAALRGGATCLQLREKELTDGELLARARRLRELTASHNALLIINDRPDIARLCGADGVHVGQDDLSVREARAILGAERLVGKSTHTLAQVDAAIAEAPDYIAVGPMFRTTTKPTAVPAGADPPGLAFLSAARIRTDLPLVAIGGINTDNARAVFAAKANCVCACSAVISGAAEAAARSICQATGS